MCSFTFSLFFFIYRVSCLHKVFHVYFTASSLSMPFFIMPQNELDIQFVCNYDEIVVNFERSIQFGLSTAPLYLTQFALVQPLAARLL